MPSLSDPGTAGFSHLVQQSDVMILQSCCWVFVDSVVSFVGGGGGMIFCFLFFCFCVYVFLLGFFLRGRVVVGVEFVGG